MSNPGVSVQSALPGLADTAVTPGTYGDATHVGQFAVDAKGRITAAADVAISGGGSPGGSDTQVQFNDGGSAFGGNANFIYDKTTGKFIAGDGFSNLVQVEPGNGAYLVSDTAFQLGGPSTGIDGGFAAPNQVRMLGADILFSRTFNSADVVLDYNVTNANVWTCIKPLLVNDYLQSSKAVIDISYDYQTPTTGFSYTIPDNIYTAIIDPAGTLLAGAITLPAVPVDGQIVRIKSSQIISTLTISPNTGQSVLGAPTTIALGGLIDCQYRAANTTWYC